MWFFQLGFSMFLYGYLHSFCGAKLRIKIIVCKFIFWPATEVVGRGEDG